MWVTKDSLVDDIKRAYFQKMGVHQDAESGYRFLLDGDRLVAQKKLSHYDVDDDEPNGLMIDVFKELTGGF